MSKDKRTHTSNTFSYPKIELANQTIAKEVAECLEAHYPGHAWAVTANVEAGMVDVYNLRLVGNWGFRLKMDAMMNDPGMKLTIQAGGEILERYNIHRGQLREKDYIDVKRDYKGDAIQA